MDTETTFSAASGRSTATNEALLAAAAARDEDACREFYSIYKSVVDRYVLSEGGGQSAGRARADDKDDIVQEVLAGVLADLPRFRRNRTGSFRHYLRTRVRNNLIDRRRKEEVRRELVGAASLDERSCGEASSPVLEDEENPPDSVSAGLDAPTESDERDPGEADAPAAGEDAGSADEPSPDEPAGEDAGSADFATESHLLLLVAALARVFRTAPGLSAKSASVFLHRMRGDSPTDIAKKFRIGLSQVSNVQTRIAEAARRALREAVERTGLDPYYDLEGLLPALFDDLPDLRARLEDRLSSLERPRDLADFRRELQKLLQERWGATHLGSTKLN